ncbi:MAG: HK97 family phage prohead protease [bacterium]
MNEFIYKTVDSKIKDIDERNRTFLAIASTEDKDRDGDIIQQSGWDLRNYEKNPVVLWAHRHTDLPIAKAEKIKVEDNKLVFKPKFATYEEYPFADTVFKLYKGGFINSFSVGFQPKESEPLDEDNLFSGRRIIKQELLEISGLPLPSNPSARIREALSKGIISEDDHKIYNDTMNLIIEECMEDFEGKGTGNGNITDDSWDGSKSRFSVQQLLASVPPAIARAARARARREDREIADIPKDWLKLPHHEPNGALNANGVRAAKGRLNQADLPEGVSRSAVMAHLDMHSGQVERWRERRSVEDEETKHTPIEIISFNTFEAALKAVKADVDLYKNKNEFNSSDKERLNWMANELKKTSNTLFSYANEEKLRDLIKRAEACLKD